jgi:hypothetical protein
MDALLAAPDCRTAQGRREHALLLFLYNSGARASQLLLPRLIVTLGGNIAVVCFRLRSPLDYCNISPPTGSRRYSTTRKVAELPEYRHVVPGHPPLCDLPALHAEHRPEIKLRSGT